jgi:hypothetical protein
MYPPNPYRWQTDIREVRKTKRVKYPEKLTTYELRDR